MPNSRYDDLLLRSSFISRKTLKVYKRGGNILVLTKIPAEAPSPLEEVVATTPVEIQMNSRGHQVFFGPNHKTSGEIPRQGKVATHATSKLRHEHGRHACEVKRRTTLVALAKMTREAETATMRTSPWPLLSSYRLAGASCSLWRLRINLSLLSPRS